MGTSTFQDAPPALDDTSTEVDTVVAIDAAPDAHVCPSGFTAMAGGQATSRYKFYGYSSSSSIVSFAQASQTCTNEGGYVAIANDAAEIAAFDTIAQNPSQAGYWLGITDAEVEGTWRTVLGELAAYLPWNTAQPNGGIGANCAVGYQSQLYDVDCAMATYVFICECTQ
ncbi:MAG TPA: C-type lectin domain-containing protein [Kofleriaceae bacterium]